MKKFILSLLYFCLPVIILSIPIDYLLSNKLKKLNNFALGENLVWNHIYDGNVNDDIVIYGSSRAWVHIDPLLIESKLGRTAYNLGIDGHNFWLQNLRHQELLKYNQKPDYIIYSVDVFTLAKRKDLYNYDQFLPYMLGNDNIHDFTSSYEGFSYFDYNFPLIRYEGKKNVIRQAFKTSILEDNAKLARVKGYRGIEKKWNKDFDKAKQKKVNFSVEIDLATVDKFNLFLNECKKNSIQVIFVYTPEYIEGQKFVTNRNEIVTLFEEIAMKHNILFLNYSDNSISKQKKYFYNALHLNKTGAELFTNKLIKDLIRTNVQTGIYN